MALNPAPRDKRVAAAPSAPPRRDPYRTCSRRASPSSGRPHISGSPAGSAAPTIIAPRPDISGPGSSADDSGRNSTRGRRSHKYRLDRAEGSLRQQHGPKSDSCQKWVLHKILLSPIHLPPAPARRHERSSGAADQSACTCTSAAAPDQGASGRAANRSDRDIPHAAPPAAAIPRDLLGGSRFRCGRKGYRHTCFGKQPRGNESGQ